MNTRNLDSKVTSISRHTLVVLLSASLVLPALPVSALHAQAVKTEKDTFQLSPPKKDQTKKDKAASEEAKRLMQSIRNLLQEASRQRSSAKKLPSRKEYFIGVPPWAETKEDREAIIREILDSALQIVTDGPIVQHQQQIRKRRKTIKELKLQITNLKERRLDAPKETMIPFSDTVSSIDDKIKDLQTRIRENEKRIINIKAKIKQAFKDKNIEMSDSQLDLLLGSVISDDIVKLVAAFEAARLIDTRLGQLMGQNNESLEAARRYFAMHAALFAMLLHAQNQIIKRIDTVYMKKLDAIMDDLHSARAKTIRLLREQNRPDQRRTLLANRKAQDFSIQVSVFYRDYLLSQRRKIAESRRRTVRDLSIADNTFETVEATFQLRTLIEDAKSSFQALERLEAPGFGQVFKNDELRREFEKLTEKLQLPSS